MWMRPSVAAAAACLVGLTSCTGPSSARHESREPVRPASASGGWQPAGSSGTGSLRPAPVREGWGPTDAEISRARRLVGRLSLRERAGQVIVASYDGIGAPTSLVNRLHLGGVIAFEPNITSAAQITRSNRDLQRSAARAGRDWPVLVGVDQEGGQVARARGVITSFPTLMAAGAAGDLALTRQVAAATGAELAGLGFNVDFAPDADVTIGPADPAIGARSAGSSPQRVAEQVRAAVEGFTASGVVPVVKHFPGHGSVTVDSHYGLPVQQASLRRLSTRDLVPFRAAVRSGAPAVMVGHLDVRAVAPHLPSSLSRRVVTGLLRERLGFGGVTFTDSLEMAAVADRFGSAGAAVHAVRAGADVVLMPPDPRAARDGLVAAVRDGRLSQARLDQAATRVVALLLHQRARGFSPRPAGSSVAVSRRLSAAAITSVAGPCSGRLVGESVSVTGPASAVSAFRVAARAAGLRVESLGGTTVRLVGSPGVPVQGDVVVALDRPYVLGTSSARVAKLATYGETPETMKVLVSVLLGQRPAPGRLPVPVADVPRAGC